MQLGSPFSSLDKAEMQPQGQTIIFRKCTLETNDMTTFVFNCCYTKASVLAMYELNMGWSVNGKQWHEGIIFKQSNEM